MSNQQRNLGGILVGDRIITRAQLSDALKNQVVYGGRLGTNLIELGYASHDQISLGLAKSWGVPAALTKHLAHHDPGLLKLVPRDVARRCLAFPIARLRSESTQIAVCFRDPIPEAVKTIESCLKTGVVPSIAAEAAVLYWLERAYGLARPQRYALSAPGSEAPMPRAKESRRIPVPEVFEDVDMDDDDSFEIEIEEPSTLPNQFQLVNLDDQRVVKDTTLYHPHQRNVSTLLEVAASASNLNLAEAAQRAASLASEAATGATAAAEVSDPTPVPARAKRPEALSLGEAVTAIANAEGREAVSNAVLGFMAGAFDGALMIIIKGDLALGYRGFGGNFDADSVESIVVPLSVPSVFRRVYDSKEAFAGSPPKEAHAVQRRFFKLFPSEPSTVVVVPVMVRKRMVCMLYGHPRGAALSAQTMRELTQIARATQEAFLRLIKSAKQTRSGA